MRGQEGERAVYIEVICVWERQVYMYETKRKTTQRSKVSAKRIVRHGL